MADISRRLGDLFEVQSGPRRNLAMEGLRGVAVTLVFLVHYHSVLEPWMAEGAVGHRFGFAIRFMGAAGVDLFFVLSGYLIYGATLSPRFAWGPFMRRRVQRIYPTFLVLLAIYLVLSFVLPAHSKLPADPGEALRYVLQNVLLLPGMFAIQPIVTVAWSLSYELFFYLALPLLMVSLGLRRQGSGRRLAVFALLAAGIIAMPLLGFGHLQFLLFVAGMAIHELRDRVRAAQEGRAGLLLGPVSSLLALVALPIAWWSFQATLASGAQISTAFVVRTVWLALAFAVVVAVVLTGRGAVARVCSWTPLRWLGNMSYSYYLLHGLVLKAFSIAALAMLGTGTQPLLFWGLLPVAFAMTLLASAVLFAWVEKPFSMGGSLPWPLRREVPELTAPVSSVAPRRMATIVMSAQRLLRPETFPRSGRNVIPGSRDVPGPHGAPGTNSLRASAPLFDTPTHSPALASTAESKPASEEASWRRPDAEETAPPSTASEPE